MTTNWVNDRTDGVDVWDPIMKVHFKMFLLKLRTWHGEKPRPNFFALELFVKSSKKIPQDERIGFLARKAKQTSFGSFFSNES